jgi:hypothetical protein
VTLNFHAMHTLVAFSITEEPNLGSAVVWELRLQQDTMGDWDEPVLQR